MKCVFIGGRFFTRYHRREIVNMIQMNYQKNLSNLFILCKIYPFLAGADLGFSRGGGGGFSKTFRKICLHFFQVDRIDFRALPKSV